MSGLFEAELLIELMLRYWNHPLADDASFRNHLLECAAEELKTSLKGQPILDGLHPENVNLVAATWCAEASILDAPESADTGAIEERRQWLDRVRHAVPSCFCDPKLLD